MECKPPEKKEEGEEEKVKETSKTFNDLQDASEDSDM